MQDIDYTALTDGESQLLRTDREMFFFLASQPNYLQQHKLAYQREVIKEVERKMKHKRKLDGERMFCID